MLEGMFWMLAMRRAKAAMRIAMSSPRITCFCFIFIFFVVLRMCHPELYAIPHGYRVSGSYLVKKMQLINTSIITLFGFFGMGVGEKFFLWYNFEYKKNF